jgi:hypothetical protein
MNKMMMTTLHPDQIFRKQMSIMAWVMCGLCAWIILLAAIAAGATSRREHYKTSVEQIDVTAES